MKAAFVAAGLCAAWATLSCSEVTIVTPAASAAGDGGVSAGAGGEQGGHAGGAGGCSTGSSDCDGGVVLSFSSLPCFTEVSPGQYEVWQRHAEIVLEGVTAIDGAMRGDGELTDGRVLDENALEIALADLRSARPISELRLRVGGGALTFHARRARLRLGDIVGRSRDAVVPID